ncbi:hypothetical protein GCM10022419_061890 [Nonomuraea rosea]|uniref:DUF4760 domain-containing protein n=1 Tax=Nonomuraea rosea TaxID=638574 RepID=A0ABP6XVZ9_9ACTN
MDGSSSWIGLEIAKLIVSALTPLTVALIGIGFARAAKRLEASQWVNQKLIEKRIELMDDALPQLNDLYCYFIWIGNWKELSPPDVIQRKRSLDRLFYANRPFFSTELITAYEEFSASLFKTYAAPGADALLRTSLVSQDGDRRTSYPKTWTAEWAATFTEIGDHTNRGTIREWYDRLMDRASLEVGADSKHGHVRAVP